MQFWISGNLQISIPTQTKRLKEMSKQSKHQNQQNNKRMSHTWKHTTPATYSYNQELSVPTKLKLLIFA